VPQLAHALKCLALALILYKKKPWHDGGRGEYFLLREWGGVYLKYFILSGYLVQRASKWNSSLPANILKLLNRALSRMIPCRHYWRIFWLFLWLTQFLTNPLQIPISIERVTWVNVKPNLRIVPWKLTVSFAPSRPRWWDFSKQFHWCNPSCSRPYFQDLGPIFVQFLWPSHSIIYLLTFPTNNTSALRR